MTLQVNYSFAASEAAMFFNPGRDMLLEIILKQNVAGHFIYLIQFT